MNFPSLLYLNEKTAPVMKPETVRDLKLDILFPEEVSSFLLRAPDGASVPLRHLLFEALLKDKTSLPLFRDLETRLKEAHRLYTAMNRSSCETAEAYIFVALFRALRELAEKISALPDYGFLAERFAGVFRQMTADPRFAEAGAKATELSELLQTADRLIFITDGENVKLRRESETDISAALRQCAEELNIPLTVRPQTDFVLQKAVAEAVAVLYPEQLAGCVAFYLENRDLVHGEMFDYVEEISFVRGILEFTERATNAGIPHAFPALSEEKVIDFKDVYDITLLLREEKHIVPNDVHFDVSEPFYYLTGANGGGKTTYLRAVGGAVLLFLAGAPVFCTGGTCCLLDSVFTHFPQDERFEGSGRFFDEIRRVDDILSRQKGNSLILLNETYATTGEDKAVEYTASLAGKLYHSGNFGLYITHQHEVNEKVIPFLGVMIDEQDKNRRTYRIEKRRLPPRSFARDILEKYGLTEEGLKARFRLE